MAGRGPRAPGKGAVDIMQTKQNLGQNAQIREVTGGLLAITTKNGTCTMTLQAAKQQLPPGILRRIDSAGNSLNTQLYGRTERVIEQHLKAAKLGGEVIGKKIFLGY